LPVAAPVSGFTGPESDKGRGQGLEDARSIARLGEVIEEFAAPLVAEVPANFDSFDRELASLDIPSRLSSFDFP
jgi:hypothetical protein